MKPIKLLRLLFGTGHRIRGLKGPFYFKLNDMENLFNIAKEITSSDYMNLKNPEFIGQTRLDVNNQYWMVFEDNGVLYKIHHSL